MKYVSYNDDKTINIISTSEFVNLDSTANSSALEDSVKLYDKVLVPTNTIKLAYICNWNQKCGISTYSKFLLDSIKNKVEEFKVFSEYHPNNETEEGVVYCWNRGEKLNELIKEIKEYKPNFVLIQHEWGLFPNAQYFMKFISQLDKLGIKYSIILHSVYEHLDKTIPLSIVKNIIVHSNEGKEVLTNLKLNSKIDVIPHGCHEVNNQGELWNIFKNPYIMFGYGFGFKYKGVDVAIDAVNHLVKNDPKFKDLLYIYVCSENENNMGTHNAYYNSLSDKVKELGIEDNVLLLRGFLSDEMLSNYLRLVKIVLFPYIAEENNTVYGASGAIKIAMSYNCPVIASYSHLFDDVNGIVPKINNYEELAQEIDKIFSDHLYKESLVKKAHEFLEKNSWKNISNMYIETIKNILNS